MNCDCKQDGFCERYGRVMVGSLRQICQSERPEDVRHCQLWLSQRGKLPEAFTNRDYVPPPVTVQQITLGRAAPAARAQCAHLGEYTGRTVECLTCRGKTYPKVFACEVFGECTIGKEVQPLRCCVGCPAWEGKADA
jgi:hypothetical protein